MQQKSSHRIPKEKGKVPLLRKQDSLQAQKDINQDKSALIAPSKMTFKYDATIRVEGDSNLIQKVFASEDTVIKETASYKLKKTPKGITFAVQAEDSVGLRTALNSITKVLTVIEKVGKIK